MSKVGKTIERVLRGGADSNIGFDDLCAVLRHLDFAERSRGSHRVFTRTGVEDMINLQRDGSHAKAYQVRQVRAILLEHGLGRESRP